ncbi:MAG: phycobilisome rod-core linker polypeptide [Leptolyngbyaceae cyanobacterium bins.349]|nr:phycobilisome rod-core linker polypeptide [Leptolyngbyaceae cyanobacterium bins.349]
MALPLLNYKPTSQDQRVSSFGSADLNEDTPYIYRLEDARTASEMDDLIWATYRQVFNEQEILQFNRQIVLETQLRNRVITVRDFIKGLAKSQRFYELMIAPNNNYRLVELTLKRLLGRSPYNEEEKIAWSIQIATLGWEKFVDTLLVSEEYTRWFGDNTVPYQRKRLTERPYSFTPRYGADYRDKLPEPRPYVPVARFAPMFEQFERFTWEKFAQRSQWGTVAGLTVVGTVLLVILLAISAGASGAG